LAKGWQKVYQNRFEMTFCHWQRVLANTQTAVRYLLYPLPKCKGIVIYRFGERSKNVKKFTILIRKNMIIKNNQTRDLLMRLKKISDVYRVANEQQRERLFAASQKTIEGLIRLGFEREFVETLLIGGRDFLQSLYEGGSDVASEQDAELIFNKGV